jgi:SAM-dependent methyltransferase
MKSVADIEIADVKALYDGTPRRIFELLLGQQIHLGGLHASLELASLADVAPRSRGVELCCGSGVSMRVLVRYCDVASMIGVDVAAVQVERGRIACEREGLSERVRFVVADACATGLPTGEADFVWGEDAWCYVIDKEALVAEANRLTRPGGTIAFTDWIEGPSGLSDVEADQLLRMMTFANLQDIGGYRSLLERQGCEVVRAEDTGRFTRFHLCAEVMRTQFAYDALEILGFDRDLLRGLEAQLALLGELGLAGKLAQGRFVARKRP